MKPEDVPTELVDAAWPVCEREGIPWHDTAVRMILAAVIPKIQGQERERVATEARFAASQVGRHSDFDWDVQTLQWFADRLGGAQ